MSTKTMKMPFTLTAHVAATTSIDEVRAHVRQYPVTAQAILEAEYKRARPRYTLIQWLKRNRLHNPTTRVIPNRDAA